MREARKHVVAILDIALPLRSPLLFPVGFLDRSRLLSRAFGWESLPNWPARTMMSFRRPEVTFR
jgi:hypothetical protein